MREEERFEEEDEEEKGRGGKRTSRDALVLRP